MAITKLIVTNMSELKGKYGKDGLKLISGALDHLVEADAIRGISTSLKAITVTDEQLVKQAIDELYKPPNNPPDYLLILGGPDVIPYQRLENPVTAIGGQADPDPDVPSDLPYACDAPYASDISNFVGSTRVVGRLPDINGATKLQLGEFTSLIAAAATFAGTPGNDSFALSAAPWSDISTENVRLAFGSNRVVNLVPPGGPTWPKEKLEAPIHFINCHGAPHDQNYFGGPPSSPNALMASDLPGKIKSGTVVTAECCFGAELHKPTDSRPLGIANTYLTQGAIAFFGSTNNSIGTAPNEARCGADVLCTEFVKAVLAGQTLGHALFVARQNYLASIQGHIEALDHKTLAQFVLLGDPSARPFGGGMAHHPSPKELLEAGHRISATRSFASRRIETHADAQLEGARRLLQEMHAVPGPTISFRVEGPDKAANELVDEVHVTFGRIPEKEAKDTSDQEAARRTTNLRAVLTETRKGQVVSYKRVTYK